MFPFAIYSVWDCIVLRHFHWIGNSWYKYLMIQIRVSLYPWTYFNVTFASLPQRHHRSFQSIKAVDQTLSRVWHHLTVCLLGVGSDNSVNENQLTGGLGRECLPRLFYMTATHSQTIQGNKNWLHHNTDSSRSTSRHTIFGPSHTKTNHVMSSWLPCAYLKL